MPKYKEGISPKEKAFYFKEYPKSLNITDAAMKVYNCKDRKVAASVGREVKQRIEEKIEQNLITPPKEFVNCHKLDEDLTGESILNHLNKIRKTAKREADKIKANELLGKFEKINLWRDHSITEDKPYKEESAEDIDAEYSEMITNN